MSAERASQDRDLRSKREREVLALRRRELDRRTGLKRRAQALTRNFAHNPRGLVEHLTDLVEQGRVRPHEAAEMFRQARVLGGRRFAGLALDRKSSRTRALSQLERAMDESHAYAEGRAAESADNVLDVDSERASMTAAHLDTLSSALGVVKSGFEVRVDDTARRRTDAKGNGASGVMEDNVVYLHPERYDPQTRAGRELLAHEVTHVAQRAAPHAASTTSAPSRAQAENEAATIGAQFARGGAMDRPKAGLPAHAKAADSDKNVHNIKKAENVDKDVHPENKVTKADVEQKLDHVIFKLREKFPRLAAKPIALLERGRRTYGEADARLNGELAKLESVLQAVETLEAIDRMVAAEPLDQALGVRIAFEDVRRHLAVAVESLGGSDQDTLVMITRETFDTYLHELGPQQEEAVRSRIRTGSPAAAAAQLGH